MVLIMVILNYKEIDREDLSCHLKKLSIKKGLRYYLLNDFYKRLNKRKLSNLLKV